MAGTKAGGIKTAATNKAKYGEGFYARIGRKGGLSGNTGGFAADPNLAKKAGAIGGRKSRRNGSYIWKALLNGEVRYTGTAKEIANGIGCDNWGKIYSHYEHGSLLNGYAIDRERKLPVVGSGKERNETQD